MYSRLLDLETRRLEPQSKPTRLECLILSHCLSFFASFSLTNHSNHATVLVRIMRGTMSMSSASKMCFEAFNPW